MTIEKTNGTEPDVENSGVFSARMAWWERNLGHDQHFVVRLLNDGTYELYIDGERVRREMAREFWMTGRETLRSRIKAAWRVLRRGQHDLKRRDR